MNASPEPLPHAADANQARASDPSASSWVSANAGTGKTEVLVRRVLRLLLAGSEPQQVLCLTYTKMAAAEMQNRLLGELASWATMADGKLRERLAALLGRAADNAEVQAARRLFAETLEAKGGLKIYTIHGFCERLLQRFPLEAQVTPHFAVLDESEALRLKGAAFDATMARAAAERDGPLGDALGKIVAVTVEDYFRKIVDTVLGKRGALARMIALHGSGPDWAKAECMSLRRLFGLADDETENTLTEALADALGDDDIDALLGVLQGMTVTASDQKLRGHLQAARAATGAARVAAMKPIFLTGENQQRKTLCSKALQQAAPQLCGALDAAQVDFFALDLKRAQLACAEASAAVLLLADTVQAEYARAKQSEAVLDYDDLILKTQTLLSRTDAAAWVLFKIDGGVDHILVDEAQDTNPAQWTIIERLAEEFFAGEGASEQNPHAVRGGRREAVDLQLPGRRSHPLWRGRPHLPRQGDGDRACVERRAAHSLVPLDRAGAQGGRCGVRQAARRGGAHFEEASVIQHHAFRTGQAGLVELWPVVAETKPEPAEAFEPWNEDAAPLHAVDVLCGRIAGQIKAWLDKEEKLDSEGRKITPGDILILVRRRDPFTAPMIRALKREKIAVAGADRMQLLEQLAVMDLVALADVLLMPEDDLSLAVVLKSPLFGLDDDDLFDLAYKRDTSLWNALKRKAKDDPRYAEAAELLPRWLARVDLMPPYEFFLELLGENGQTMRKRMLTRLGPEAAEAIDEFLDLALDLRPGVRAIAAGLRQCAPLDRRRDQARHGAEARRGPHHDGAWRQGPAGADRVPAGHLHVAEAPRREHLFARAARRPAGGGRPSRLAAGGNALAHIEEAKAALRKAEREEYHRLLYVAMTRARDRLYVCGWSQKEAPEKASWYDLVDQGLRGLLTEETDYDGKPVRRLISKQTVTAKAPDAAATGAEAAPLPDWASRPAPPERSRELLTPSGLGALMGDPGSPYAEQPPLGPAACRRPPLRPWAARAHAAAASAGGRARRAGARGAGLRRRAGHDLPESLREEIVSETLAIVQDPRFAPLFQPGSLGEVPIVARFGERDLSGQIDRLAVLDDALLMLDYKTNRPPPKTPDEVAPAYIAQLAAYRAALRLMFPARALRAAIVWTDGPKLMEIPSTLLDAAERRILAGGASLDVHGVRT